jgi:hypothetical protein
MAFDRPKFVLTTTDNQCCEYGVEFFASKLDAARWAATDAGVEFTGTTEAEAEEFIETELWEHSDNDGDTEYRLFDVPERV